MDYSTQRTNMVESQVRPSDVTDRRILRAMAEVPRELFVPDALRSLAYGDGGVRLAKGGRSLMAPRTFAKLLQAANLEQTGSVLIVGAGTGYSAAVASPLAAEVVALECDERLAGQARKALADLGLGNVSVVTGELPDGWVQEAPYELDRRRRRGIGRPAGAPVAAQGRRTTGCDHETGPRGQGHGLEPTGSGLRRNRGLRFIGRYPARFRSFAGIRVLNPPYS